MESLPSPTKASSSQHPLSKKKRPTINITGNATPINHSLDPSDTLDLSKLRAHAACKNCRAKKVKCLPSNPNVSLSQLSGPGGDPPPCLQCVSAGAECVYPPTRDRAAYSRQYVQNLEARVQALEGVWGRVAPMLEVFEAGSGNSTGNRPGLITDGTKIRSNSLMSLIHPNEPDDNEEEAPDGAEDDASSHQSGEDGGQITQDERGNYRWIGSSNTLSLLDSFTAAQGSTTAGPSQGHGLAQPHARGLGSGNRTPAGLGLDRTDSPAQTNPYFGPVAGSGVVKALPGIDEVSYPSHRAARDMVDAFFRDVHPTLPVVVEHDFRVEFDKLMDRRSRGETELSSPTFVSVLFAVFALGERVVLTGAAWLREKAKMTWAEGEETVMPGEAEAGVIWYERAQILHYTTLKDVNIHQVQCLTLMAAFQASVNAMPMAWLLAGQAIRVAQDLGLHRSTARLKMPFAEKQLRARCWWAIYGLERMVSIALGRPLGVDDLDIDVAYPTEADDAILLRLSSGSRDQTPQDIGEEPHESTMSGFVALTKLCKIAGRVAHVLYRPSNKSVNDPSWANSQQNTINKLDKLLRDWLANDVPTKYKDPSSNRKVQLVSAVLSNSYFAVLLTLHRNFLPANPDYPRPKPPPNSQSLSHCVDAARSVIHVAAQSRVLVPPSHHLAVFCQFLWSSAVILLLCEVQARDQVVVDAVGSQVESCRRSLQALEPVWPGCRKLKELLNDVESRTKEVVSHPDRPADRKRKSSSDKRSSVQPSFLQTPQNRPGSANQPGYTTTAEKRPRIYETSDTRTNLPPHDNFTQPMQYQPYQPQLTPSVMSNPSSFPGFDMSQLNSVPNQQQSDQFQAFDTTFDIGGVTFDGLEMLQGFTGIDPASIWGTLTDGFVQTPTPAGGAAFQSAQGTPNSQNGAMMAPTNANGNGNGNGTGPSPTSMGMGMSGNNGWQYMPSGGGSGNTPGGSGVNGNLVGTELWNQVSGGIFDWGSDPNVPFNI